MIDTPKITQTTEQLTAMIHVTVPRSEIQKVMGPGIQEVKAAIAAQGVTAAGTVAHAPPEDGPQGVRLRDLRAGRSRRSPPRAG